MHSGIRLWVCFALHMRSCMRRLSLQLAGPDQTCTAAVVVSLPAATLLHQLPWYSTQVGGLQLVFEEEAESSLGPFSSTAKLTSVGGTIFYASGKGRVSTALAPQPPMQSDHSMGSSLPSKSHHAGMISSLACSACPLCMPTAQLDALQRSFISYRPSGCITAHILVAHALRKCVLWLRVFSNASSAAQGRGKKDAKQLAAAALLEELLGTVDRIEFLLPGKPKHLPPSRVRPASILSGVRPMT